MCFAVCCVSTRFGRNVYYRSRSGNPQHVLESLPSPLLLVWNGKKKTKKPPSCFTHHQFSLKVHNRGFSFYSPKKMVGETVKWSEWSSKVKREAPFSWAHSWWCSHPVYQQVWELCSQGCLFQDTGILICTKSILKPIPLKRMSPWPGAAL